MSQAGLRVHGPGRAGGSGQAWQQWLPPGPMPSRSPRAPGRGGRATPAVGAARTAAGVHAGRPGAFAGGSALAVMAGRVRPAGRLRDRCFLPTAGGPRGSGEGYWTSCPVALLTAI